MANVNEIFVGTTVKVNEEYETGIAFMNALMGVNGDLQGVVKAVEPTTAVIANYPEINPHANGKGKVIYFDALAERHYIIPAVALDVVAEGGLQ